MSLPGNIGLLSRWPNPATSSAFGNVDGPAAGGSTDNAVCRWDGTTGRLIQNSVLIVADTTGALSGFGAGAGITFSGGGNIVGTSGSLDLAASGTNQNITLTPSGTGIANVVGGAGLWVNPTNIAAALTNTLSVVDAIGTNTNGLRVTRHTVGAAWLAIDATNALLGTDAPALIFKTGIDGGSGDITTGTERARIVASSGNLLLGGLTSDGGADKQLQISSTNKVNFGATANATIGVSADTTSGVLTLTAPSSGSISLTKLISSYNGIATAGNGVVSVQGVGRATAQTGAVASVATYTVGAADASFIVSFNVLVTASTTHNFTVTCSYTDESNTARTGTMNSQTDAGTIGTTITQADGAVPHEGIPMHIRAKAGTAITVATTGTFTDVTYNVEAAITKLM